MPFGRSFFLASPVVPRLCRSLRTLAAEIDERWPNRSTAADGWIGDPQHALRVSDHNPDGAGIVHALDVTSAGIDPMRVLEAARLHPAASYVIYDRQIWLAESSWRPHAYQGPNPHETHMHVSVVGGRRGSSSKSWGLAPRRSQSAGT